MPKPAHTPIDAVASREIENLIARYAELVDDGDFAGVGELLAAATYRGGDGAPLVGQEAIESWFRKNLLIYPDGTPRTQHVTTNTIIEVDEQTRDAAIGRSYVTVLQALDGRPPQIIAGGRYRDRFEHHDGTWRFVERRVNIRFFGDLSNHLRPAVKQG